MELMISILKNEVVIEQDTVRAPKGRGYWWQYLRLNEWRVESNRAERKRCMGDGQAIFHYRITLTSGE